MLRLIDWYLILVFIRARAQERGRKIQVLNLELTEIKDTLQVCLLEFIINLPCIKLGFTHHRSRRYIVLVTYFCGLELLQNTIRERLFKVPMK